MFVQLMVPFTLFCAIFTYAYIHLYPQICSVPYLNHIIFIFKTVEKRLKLLDYKVWKDENVPEKL